ncbi:TetR/AcrR family transcriptional regulator [Streptomyces tendae]|uniref:TetR/AcrR family transcriptional regulator n=1 Tax=Streptomyces tendae TaxID=1932 RepID=UPI003D65904E
MGRVSKAQAQENRQRVVETASRLFREQGTNVSVADLMKAVGLTHGGFYKQFASKEALVDEATAYAFEETADAYPPEYGVREVVESYLSVEHRDDAAEAARSPASPPTGRGRAASPRPTACTPRACRGSPTPSPTTTRMASSASAPWWGP